MALELIDINFEYEGINFTDINLSFFPGKIYGIVCNNKYIRIQLAQIMAGIRQPISGEVKYNDDLVDTYNLLKNAGVAIGNPQFIDNLTIYDNLKLLGMINNVSKDTILDLMGKYELDFDDKTKFQFVALEEASKAYVIQALMENPDLIILDEIVVCFDKIDRELFTEHMTQLRNEGKTIILLESHHFNIYKFCDVMLKVENDEVIEYEFQ